MIKLGVTGGIGSGKTMVCTIISAMGYPVYNADLEARKVVDTNQKVISFVKNLLGDDIYVNNHLDRSRVAEQVFSNPLLLDRLNSIIHPAVLSHFNEWLIQYKTREIVVKEAAILFESGAYKGVDKVVSVTSPLELRIQRVSERDGISRDSIINRMNNQFSQDELIKRSDFIIENDGVKLILPQIVRLINDLVKDS